MKTIDNNTKKRIYLQPEIEFIKLDNDISLALESAPPGGPDEVSNRTPEYFNAEPFKANLV